MRIGITSSSNVNPYASTLALRLIKQLDKPVCFITAQPSKLSVLRSYLKNYGLVNTWFRLFKKIPTKENRYLTEYAQLNGLTDFKLSLGELAHRSGIKNFKSDDINSEQVVNFIKKENIDILINAGGGVFKQKIIEAPRRGIISAHMGVLPDFRGMNVLEWSLFYEKRIGVTIHFVVKGIDLGDILLFRKIEIEESNTIDELRDKSVPINVELLAETVRLIKNGRVRPIRQDPNEGRQYYVMHERLKRIVEGKISQRAKKGFSKI